MPKGQRLSIVRPKRSLVELRGLCPWIVLTLALGIGAIYAMLGMNAWDPFQMKAIEEELSLWEVFFSVFGLMYAIIVGLFLVEAYRRWQELSSTIQSESNALGDIHDCLQYFDDKELSKDNITQKLCAYVETIKDDWDKMKNPQENGMIERVQIAGVRPMLSDWWKTSRREYRIERFKYKGEDKGICSIIEDLGELKLDDANVKKQHALELVMDRICEITTHRVNRLELAEHGLSLSLYVLVFFMSVVIILATLILNLDNVRLHGFIVFSTTVALISLFLLLYDMDHPFIGFWCIWKEPLQDIKKKLCCREEEQKVTKSGSRLVSWLRRIFRGIQ